MTDTPTIKALYKIGLIILIPLCLLAAFSHTGVAQNLFFNSGLHCALKRATGIPCPGCGGTRAAFALASLHIVESIQYNITVFAAVLVYVIFMSVETLHFKLGTRGFSEKGFFIMFYGWLAATMIHWIIKITVLFI